MSEPDGHELPERCPTCGKPSRETFRPFCSKRCADVDLHRWLSGVYVIPVAADEEPDDGDGAGQQGRA